MSNILVSVIMCTFNTPSSYLDEAVFSIINQTYKNIELIIVDDYSETPVSINKYNDKRIKLIRNEKNLGQGLSRNIALNIAKGKYIAIMDSDDVSLNVRIEKQVDFMERNLDVAAAGSWFNFFGDKNHSVKRYIPQIDEFRCLLFFNNSPTILNPSVIIRKSIMDDNNIKYPSTRYAEDYFLWVVLSQYGIVTNVNEILLNYRCHSAQSSNKKNISEKLNVYRYQFDKIKLKYEEESLINFYNANNNIKYNAIKYRNLVKKIINAIKKDNEFLPYDVFCKSSLDNWYLIIRRVKNPFKLFILMFCDIESLHLVFKSIWHRIKRIY